MSMAATSPCHVFYDDPKVRKFVAKREASKLLWGVRHFCEIGRYPGGAWKKEEPVH